MSPEFYQGDWQDHPDNPDARNSVKAFLDRFIALAQKHGGMHIQIGKLYPFSENRQAENSNAMAACKKHFDPDNIINPGALGFAE